MLQSSAEPWSGALLINERIAGQHWKTSRLSVFTQGAIFVRRVAEPFFVPRAHNVTRGDREGFRGHFAKSHWVHYQIRCDKLTSLIENIGIFIGTHRDQEILRFCLAELNHWQSVGAHQHTASCSSPNPFFHDNAQFLENWEGR